MGAFFFAINTFSPLKILEKDIPLTTHLPLADYEKILKIVGDKIHDDIHSNSIKLKKESGLITSTHEREKPIKEKLPTITTVKKEETSDQNKHVSIQRENNQPIFEKKNDEVKKIEIQAPEKEMITDAKKEKESEENKFKQFEILKQMEQEFPFTLLKIEKPIKKAITTDKLYTDDPYKKIKAVILQNGDVIEGKIISIDPDIVKIRTKGGKVLSYDFKKEVQSFITE